MVIDLLRLILGSLVTSSTKSWLITFSFGEETIIFLTRLLSIKTFVEPE